MNSNNVDCNDINLNEPTISSKIKEQLKEN